VADLEAVAWPPAPIRTERLVLREPEARDRESVIELFASPEVNTTTPLAGCSLVARLATPRRNLAHRGARIPGVAPVCSPGGRPVELRQADGGRPVPLNLGLPPPLTQRARASGDPVPLPRKAEVNRRGQSREETLNQEQLRVHRPRVRLSHSAAWRFRAAIAAPLPGSHFDNRPGRMSRPTATRTHRVCCWLRAPRAGKA
jgi:hypothetical protein